MMHKPVKKTKSQNLDKKFFPQNLRRHPSRDPGADLNHAFEDELHTTLVKSAAEPCTSVANSSGSLAVANCSSYSTLGVRVDAVQIPDVVVLMEQWIERREHCHYVAVTGMHGVTEAQHDAGFKH